jgi:hypothetical protein
MGLLRRRNKLVETRTTRPTLMTRIRGPNANTRTVKTTTKIEPRSAVEARTQGHHHHNHHTHTTTHAAPMHSHYTRSSRFGTGRRTANNHAVMGRRRHVSLGDKIGGAMTKLRGSLTNSPAVKVCL